MWHIGTKREAEARPHEDVQWRQGLFELQEAEAVHRWGRRASADLWVEETAVEDWNEEAGAGEPGKGERKEETGNNWVESAVWEEQVGGYAHTETEINAS